MQTMQEEKIWYEIEYKTSHMQLFLDLGKF